MNLHFYDDYAKFFICAFMSVNTGQLLMFSFVFCFWVFCVVVAWGASFL